MRITRPLKASNVRAAYSPPGCPFSPLEPPRPSSSSSSAVMEVCRGDSAGEVDEEFGDRGSKGESDSIHVSRAWMTGTSCSG